MRRPRRRASAAAHARRYMRMRPRTSPDRRRSLTPQTRCVACGSPRKKRSTRIQPVPAQTLRIPAGSCVEPRVRVLVAILLLTRAALAHPPPPPEDEPIEWRRDRAFFEWSTWIRLGLGVAREPGTTVARSTL